VESLPSRPSDIASAPVPDPPAAFHGHPETDLTRAEMDARHAAIRAVASAGFAMAVMAVIGRVRELVAGG
jgi:hypothetical protein